jgi:hypothetical protein
MLAALTVATAALFVSAATCRVDALASGGTRVESYDGLGGKLKTIDMRANGAQRLYTFAYDEAGRFASLSLVESLPAATFACFQREPCHRPASRTETSASLRFDDRQRPIEVTRHDATLQGAQRAARVDYDRGGRITNIADGGVRTTLRYLDNWVAWTKNDASAYTRVAIFDADTSMPRSLSTMVCRGAHDDDRETCAPVDLVQYEADEHRRITRRVKVAPAFIDQRSEQRWRWDTRLRAYSGMLPQDDTELTWSNDDAKLISIKSGAGAEQRAYTGACAKDVEQRVPPEAHWHNDVDLCVHLMTGAFLCATPPGPAAATTWRLHIDAHGTGSALDLPL